MSKIIECYKQVGYAVAMILVLFVGAFGSMAVVFTEILVVTWLLPWYVWVPNLLLIPIYLGLAFEVTDWCMNKVNRLADKAGV